MKAPIVPTRRVVVNKNMTPINKNRSALFDYDAIAPTYGLFGRWHVDIRDENGARCGACVLSEWSRCMMYAKEQGVSPLRMRYTAIGRLHKPVRR